MIPFLGFAALSAATGGHGILDGVKYMIEADPAKMNAINAWNAPEPEVRVAADHHRYVLQQPVLVVHQPVLCPAFSRGKEPQGRPEGRYFLRLPQVPRPSVPVIPGIIAFYLPSIQDKLAAAGSSAIDFADPALISEIVPKPVMGFFAAVMFGAILSSFNSGPELGIHHIHPRPVPLFH
ncbi:MAG: hypothetical protein ACLR4Z_08880 [Butyricicoccaceae bacterium]